MKHDKPKNARTEYVITCPVTVLVVRRKTEATTAFVAQLVVVDNELAVPIT